MWWLGCVLRKGNRLSGETEAEGGGGGPLLSGVFGFFPLGSRTKAELNPAASRETGAQGGRGRGVGVGACCGGMGEWRHSFPSASSSRPHISHSCPSLWCLCSLHTPTPNPRDPQNQMEFLTPLCPRPCLLTLC